jgi:uncharacterized membrane protein
MGTRVRERAAGLPRNVGESERWASMLGGALTALYGLRRGDAAGAAIALAGGALVARGAVGYCPVYAAMDASTAEGSGGRGVARVQGRPTQQHGRSAVLDASESERIVRSVTVNAPPARLYAFWRDFANLPKVMEYIESVEILDDRRSRWRAKSVGGATVEWVSEIVRDEPNEFISWKTVAGSDVTHAGSVHFRPSTTAGTEVRVEIDYDPPGGRLGRVVAALTGRDPNRQVAEELRRLKHLVESGEAPAAK